MISGCCLPSLPNGYIFSFVISLSRACGVTQLDKTDGIIPLRPWEANAPAGQTLSNNPHPQKPPERVAFDRRELQTILGFYGNKVAEGEWRD